MPLRRSGSGLNQVGNAIQAQPPCMLQGVEPFLIYQRRIGPGRQQALNHGRVALHDGQDQRRAARCIGGVDGGALLEQAFEQLQASCAGGVLQCTGQPVGPGIHFCTR